ncbi:cyclophilin-like fold protein [Nitrospirillum sp. BR 11752]|uniref:cyclophilin-like fold protein n=1 Tax=Nitrospirillum sp. BR 11752 TaxID=3104293 RepID=UPI002EB856F6|nr:cyclophilin-like fold protein [Nitrospirillum sp. BR 11752]
MIQHHPLPVIASRRGFITGLAAGITCPQLAAGSEGVTGRKERGMKIRIAFSSHSFTASLEDNPSAWDFASLLPLALSISDYSTNEKIAYLPRKLSEEGDRPFGNEAPGDLCYYAPWGNLAFFHAGYRYSAGLIRLGRLEDGIAPLLTRGTFPLHIDRLS